MIHRQSVPAWLAPVTAIALAFAVLAPHAGMADAAADHPGRKAYLKDCAGCHGQDLVGQFGAALTGEGFRTNWSGKADALREKIATTMPPSKPGELPRETYDALVAYLLKANGMDGDTATAEKARPGGRSEIPGPMPQILDSVDNRDAGYTAVMAHRSGRLAKLSPVSEAMLRDPPSGDWLLTRRTDDAHGFSPLDQITTANASHLQLAWAKALAAGTNGITPLVHDGVIFINSNGTVYAIDAVSGDTLWSFARPIEIVNVGPPVSQPASMAIHGERLYVPTNDAHVIALDIRTGKLVWDQAIAGFHKTLKTSAAPLIVGDRLIQGMSGCAGGGEPGGCFIVGLDLATGKEIWRTHTIARPGTKEGASWNSTPLDQRFGGSVWTAGSFDAGTGLVYFGVGQTYHITDLMRPKPKASKDAAALYTSATLALDPQTGRIVWYFQHMPREIWDLDWSFERTLATLTIKGKKRRVVLTMGKTAMLDILDAKSGKYLGSRDLGLQNVVASIDPVTGAKTARAEVTPEPGKPILVCPHAVGARNKPATSFDARTGLLYVPLFKGCMSYLWTPGLEFDINWGMQLPQENNGQYGRIVALDVESGKTRWSVDHRTSQSSAALTTAGGVLFEGGRDFSFRASDSATGAQLWQTRLTNAPSAAPITFMADGVQYVAITSGGGNPHDATVNLLTPELDPAPSGTLLWVFRLPQTGG